MTYIILILTRVVFVEYLLCARSYHFIYIHLLLCFLSMSFFFFFLTNFIKMYFSYSIFTVLCVTALFIDEEAKV